MGALRRPQTCSGCKALNLYDDLGNYLSFVSRHNHRKVPEIFDESGACERI